MKKVVVSVIAGLTIIGAASAVPSPGDRKKLCEQKPMDFVWVEKTQACVPVDPCGSMNQKIKEAYCIDTYGHIRGDKAITRYFKNVMKVSIDHIKGLDGPATPHIVRFGVYTTDGGYYGLEFWVDDGAHYEANDVLRLACWAYGKKSYYSTAQDLMVYRFGCIGVNSDKECNDIADFASLLEGELVEGTVEQMGQKVCMLRNMDGWKERYDTQNPQSSADYQYYP